MEDVASALDELTNKANITLEQLLSNEQFLDTLLQATQAAIRTHVAEKREALRNATVNAALPASPDEALQSMFISLVDQFTVWHLRLLKYAQDPRRWFQELQGFLPDVNEPAPEVVFPMAFPEASVSSDFLMQVWNDLFQRGLVVQSRPAQWVHPHELDKATSPLGDQMLSFIQQPPRGLGDAA
jgi:hypothetical protein